MSYLVLHMNKFQKDGIRGIQSHNQRERESHSNPDIDYDRSFQNYDLCPSAPENYPQFIQNRIDDLLLVKAVRKDAVHMCGLIVSSDSAFFERLSPEETRRFFEESAAFLTEFVGRENVISAKVHMDEKTPHMHFLHVPVTPDGRLSANKIYTRESLRKLQTELPRYLQERGFEIQRGVEQTSGSAKKHLDTREFKQQQEALRHLEKEVATQNAELERKRQEESALAERLLFYEQQAEEAKKILSENTELPQASVFNFKSVLENARAIMDRQKKALAVKRRVDDENARLKNQVAELQKAARALNHIIARLEAEKEVQREKSNRQYADLESRFHNVLHREEETERFFQWVPEAKQMFREYQQQRQEEARRRAEEQKRQAEERERQQQEQARQGELARQQVERDKAVQREREPQRRRRGMGMRL